MVQFDNMDQTLFAILRLQLPRILETGSKETTMMFQYILLKDEIEGGAILFDTIPNSDYNSWRVNAERGSVSQILHQSAPKNLRIWESTTTQGECFACAQKHMTTFSESSFAMIRLTI